MLNSRRSADAIARERLVCELTMRAVSVVLSLFLCWHSNSDGDLIRVFGVNSRGRELTELLPDHVWFDLHGVKLLAVVNLEAVAKELGENGGGAREDGNTRTHTRRTTVSEPNATERRREQIGGPEPE